MGVAGVGDFELLFVFYKVRIFVFSPVGLFCQGVSGSMGK